MKDFYEQFWADQPQDPTPWEWERRLSLLLAEIRPGDYVLDLGCGAGRFVGELGRRDIATVGVEVAGAALERARVNVPNGDFRLLEDDGSIPLAHNSVDLVWCSEVLEHVADTAGFLSEVRRVLRPGGRLLLTTPFHGPIKSAFIALTSFESHFNPLGQHLRFYTGESLRSVLLNAHFGEIYLDSFGGFIMFREVLVARAR